MRRFLSFLAAAGNYGVVSVAITAVLLTISIIEHTRDKNVVAYWLLFIAALVFCVGAYIAWSEENKKLEAEKAKHDAPKFTLNIETIVTAYWEQSNITSVCFAAYLTNRGAPSHAGGWHVRYQSHSIDVTVKYNTLPHERVELPIGGRKLVLKRNDLLPARSLPSVERGQTKHGRVLFEIPGDRRQEIYSGQAVMWVGFFDNASRLCQALFQSTSPIEDLKTYPDEEFV